jgi:UDP-GlcNAc:polypeptide alpha-N-acetylglucosaminyltransferase
MASQNRLSSLVAVLALSLLCVLVWSFSGYRQVHVALPGRVVKNHKLQKRSLSAVVKKLNAELVELNQALQEEERVAAEFRSPTSAQTPAPSNLSNASAGPLSTIFVSIASFRDVECGPTIKDMFDKALHPRRIFMGVVDQRDPSEVPCVPPHLFDNCPVTADPDRFCPKDNVRLRTITPREAKGPTFGRYVAMLLYRGETYFMMIDSHNRFRRYWDDLLIKMYLQASAISTFPGKAVLSHYPGAYNGEPQEVLERFDRTTVMCSAHFMPEFGFIRMDGAVMMRSVLPRRQPFSAAGFLFSSGNLVDEVPFDPYLDYLFDGEELLYSARMWTHGWDIFAPSENVLFHFYIRANAPKVWSVEGNSWWPNQRVSQDRLRYILQLPKKGEPGSLQVRRSDFGRDPRVFAEIERFTIGTNRSIADYWKFATIDPVQQTMGDPCRAIRAAEGR